MKRQFITQVTAMGSNTKNERGSALFNWTKEKYEGRIMYDHIDIASMIIDIEAKMKYLAKEFPRLKQNIKPIVQPNFDKECTQYHYIQVFWDDKNGTEMFSIRTQDIKE